MKHSHTVIIGPPEDNVARCELCGKTAELRPYGPNGESVCFSCGMKDQPSAIRRFGKMLGATEQEIEDVIADKTADRQVDQVDCETCLGHGKITDGDSNQLRKCLDCNGSGVHDGSNRRGRGATGERR